MSDCHILEDGNYLKHKTHALFILSETESTMLDKFDHKRVVIVTTRFVVKLPQNCIFERKGQNMCQGVKAECNLLVMV